jgi:hypothetical protein
MAQSRIKEGRCERAWSYIQSSLCHTHALSHPWLFLVTSDSSKVQKLWPLLGRRLTVADAQGPRKLHTKKKTEIFLKRRKENDSNRNPSRWELLSYF